MTSIQQIDFALLLLYGGRRKESAIKIIDAFTENGQKITIEELQNIKYILEEKEYAIFDVATKIVDYSGLITDKGIEFVKRNYFSKLGTSILNLYEP